RAGANLNHIRRFRILVMGRANAGKTTILQRLCNTTDQPEIFDGKGRKQCVINDIQHGDHSIENELVFKSNSHYIFHDSCGFEAGSEEQFKKMKEFVMDRAKTPKLEKRIHAIWFCIPLTDTHRMVTMAERKFFDECETGHVPVIVLLTKADSLELEAFQEIEELQLEPDEAERRMIEIQGRMLDENLEKVKKWLNRLKFQPHDFLPLTGKFSIITGMQQPGADCSALLKCTADVLNDESLQMLLISTQQSSLALCMEFAIKK
ncbi:GTP-binding protein, partial [Pisolithus tinctorius]